MTDLEHFVGTLDPGITRVKNTSAGLIIEANATDKHSSYPGHLYDVISENVWNVSNEIVHSIYTYSSTAERFSVEAILRERRTEQAFNMSTSVLGSNDIFCKFTRFDFDVLTLADRNSDFYGFFIIEKFSPNRKPTIEYQELDIQGFQFFIQAKVFKKEEFYTINLQPGLDFI